jgi:Flp pilus assembly protein TadD
MLIFSKPLIAFSSTSRRIVLSVWALFLCAICSTAIRGQGAIDYTGTGGRHAIEGRLYFPSGRKADAPGIKVTLESSAAGNLMVFSDFNGTFSFRNLSAGSYTVVIEGTDDYEGTRENVYIDDPGSSSIRTSSVSSSTPRNVIVPIYLIPKRSNTARPGVVDATLAAVPKPAVDLYYQALASSQAGDPKKAITQLEKALVIYPQFPRALNELGVQYLKVGQIRKAVLTLQSAVRLAPDDFAPLLNYGIALLENNNFVEAETQLRLVLQKNDNAATPHMYLGIALIHIHTTPAADNARYLEAEKELQRALTLGKDQVVQAHYYLAGIYWRNGQHHRAADELETYLKLAPNAPDADRTRATIRELRSKG